VVYLGQRLRSGDYVCLAGTPFDQGADGDCGNVVRIDRGQRGMAANTSDDPAPRIWIAQARSFVMNAPGRTNVHDSPDAATARSSCRCLLPIDVGVECMTTLDDSSTTCWRPACRAGQIARHDLDLVRE
jgi:hypothetical protein